MTPQRVQMSRQHPWRAEHPDAVIVARPSKWGNPERMLDRSKAEREDAYWWFARFIKERRAGEPATVFIASHIGYPSDAEIVAELAGRDLACWCPLDQPCHADVLLEIANGGDA